MEEQKPSKFLVRGSSPLRSTNLTKTTEQVAPWFCVITIYLYYMIITEGILALTKFQYRQLTYFLSQVRTVADEILFVDYSADYGMWYKPNAKIIVNALNKKSNELHTRLYQMPPIQFYFYPGSNWTARYNNPTIDINLSYLSRNNDHNNIEIIWWHKVKSSIVHEWIHHKQSLKIPKKAIDWIGSDDPEYFLKPDQEHMTIAASEVEDLRSLLNTIDPKRIISQLKKFGITRYNLKTLKQSHPKAWKRIMKNAIMYALHAPGEE